MRGIHEQLNEVVRRSTEGHGGASGPALPFANREHAGRLLAQAIHVGDVQRVGPWLVLATQRAAVPVAAEVAHALGAPLDVLITLKMGPPGKPEVSAGAMAAGGVRVENRDIIESLAIPQGEVEAMSVQAFADLAAREAELRGPRGAPKLEGRTVVLIDEGIAGSALLLAALSSARAQGAARVIVAAPVGAAPAVDELGREADQVVCAAVAEQFFTISPFYEEFADVSVEQARRILERAWSEGLEPEREVVVGGL